MALSQLEGGERRVVPFARPSDRARSRSPDTAGLGVVLLFTGVRYERQAAPPDVRTPRPSDPNAAT